MGQGAKKYILNFLGICLMDCVNFSFRQSLVEFINLRKKEYILSKTHIYYYCPHSSVVR